MRTLEEIRKDINALDSELRRLFLKRMVLSLEVAEQKKGPGSSIYHPEREAEVLSEITKGLSADLSGKVASIYRSIMRLSRELQYSLLLDTSASYTPGFSAASSEQSEKPSVVCYQGLPGAYSFAASRIMYPDSTYKNVGCFEDIFVEVSKETAHRGVLPLENSTAGIVSEVYDLLMKYNLYINRSFMLPINHALLARKDASPSSLRRVLSHPHALSQCSEFLKATGLEAVPVSNTAVAAKMVADFIDSETAAIASEDLSEIYGLQILKKDIANEKNNYTRFISISPSLLQSETDNKIIIAFNLPHRSGSLAEALSIFADYGVNLSHIQSRPRPGTPWEYSFYVDFDGNLLEKRTRAVLLQLERELPMLKILGTYEKSGDL